MKSPVISVTFMALFREETKGRFCKRAVLANVPSFQFLVPSFLFLYPRPVVGVCRSIFCTLVLVAGVQGTRCHRPLNGLFRGAVFRHGGGAQKQPIKQPTEMPTSTMALMAVSLLNGLFSNLNGPFPRFRPKGPFCLLKIHRKTAH